jgi:hypothetical protein
MGVEKMSVSFDLRLGEAIRTSATGKRQSVSAWLADAARDRLRLEALGQAVTAWEKTHGILSAEEIAAADRALDGAAGKRRSGAA